MNYPRWDGLPTSERQARRFDSGGEELKKKEKVMAGIKGMKRAVLKPEKAALSIKIEQELYNDIQAVAQEKDWSMAKTAINLIKRGLGK